MSRKLRVVLDPFPHLHIMAGAFEITAKASKDQRLKRKARIIDKPMIAMRAGLV